ncbi:CLUMA_CG005519, isoform A, partial [Clunio marinus]
SMDLPTVLGLPLTLPHAHRSSYSKEFSEILTLERILRKIPDKNSQKS